MRFFALILFGLIAISFGEDSGSETDSYYSYDWDSSEESIEERILGGSVVTDLKQYSYQVGLINVKSETILESESRGPAKMLRIKWNGGECGGSIIHPKVVLTAAHCVQDSIYVAVFYGTKVKQTDPRARSNIRVEPENIKSHVDYYHDGEKGTRNDIAILILPVSIIKEGDSSTSVIPLASYTWTNCDGDGETSGWGLIDTDFKTEELRSVNVSTLDYETCNWFNSHLIEEQQICIDGSQFKGTCSGDSGGPFVQFRTNGERYLCGVTSYGMGGEEDIYKNAQNKDVVNCRNDKPKVFTSVGYYNDNQWICNNSNRLVGCENGGSNDGNHSFDDDNSSEEYNNNGNDDYGTDQYLYIEDFYYKYRNGVFYPVSKR